MDERVNEHTIRRDIYRRQTDDERRAGTVTVDVDEVLGWRLRIADLEDKAGTLDDETEQKMWRLEDTLTETREQLREALSRMEGYRETTREYANDLLENYDLSEQVRWKLEDLLVNALYWKGELR